MTIEEINNLVLDLKTIEALIPRIIDVTAIEGAYIDFDLDESKSNYERIILHNSLILPSESRIEEEFEEYKNELIQAEEARLEEVRLEAIRIEEERVQNIKDRFAAMVDVRIALNELSLAISNPALELKRIIAENDQDRLSALEVAYGIATAKIQAAKAKEDIAKIGEIAHKKCRKALCVIAGHNAVNTLTTEQINELKITFSEIKGYLNDDQPKAALALVLQVTPTQVVTQEMLDHVIEELS